MLKGRAKLHDLHWHRLVIACFCGGLLILSLSGLSCLQRELRAQQSAQDSSHFVYDVASIRPYQVTGGSFQRTILEPPHSGNFHATAVTVKVLMHFAYGIEENQIEGGPSWENHDLYDVNAKADSSVSEALKKMPEDAAVRAKRHMLQDLLVSRFQLATHNETHVGSINVLTATRRGFKIKPDAQETPGSGGSETNHGGMHMDGDTLIFQHIAFDDFVHLLSELTHAAIIDKTGITGTYSFKLRFQFGKQVVASTGSDSTLPTIEDALPVQLGLKLGSQKGQVNVLVIDRLEKPSPN